MLTVLPYLLFAQPIQPGAYGMPELCAKLHAITGKLYEVSADLVDYPVFVSVHSGDTNRTLELVADALGAKWTRNGADYRLERAQTGSDAGLQEFESEYKRACGDDAVKLALPIEDLYSMPVGGRLRFGYPSRPNLRPLPEAILNQVLAGTSAYGLVSVYRKAKGAFQFLEILPGPHGFATSQILFHTVPAEVESILGPELRTAALTDADRDTLREEVQGHTRGKIDWAHPDRRDPIAVTAEPALRGIAGKIPCDFAVALPDTCAGSIESTARGDRSVRSILQAFDAAVDWKVKEGAVVGQIPSCDLLACPQTRRSALATLFASMGSKPIVSGSDLIRFVQRNRPAASNSDADKELLKFAGVALDPHVEADYPYNVRFIASLTPADEALLGAKRTLAGAALSPGAQTALVDLLLNSHRSMRLMTGDPVFWKSTAPADMRITSSVTDDEVLIDSTDYPPSIDSLQGSARSYDAAVARFHTEPLYVPAQRQSISLEILDTVDNVRFTATYGFLRTLGDGKPLTWDKLAGAKEFQKERDAFRLQMRGQQEKQGSGTPPPK